MKTIICTAALALAAMDACAQLAQAGEETGRNVIAVSTARESLSNGGRDWRETALRYRHEFGAGRERQRHLIEGAVGETSRFGLHDSQLSAAYVTPLAPKLTATFDGNLSSTHRVLAKHAAGATLQTEFAPAWLLHTGARTTRYDAVRVNQGLLMLEHYVSAFSWALAWRPARAYGATAHGVELRGSYYYNDRNALTLSLGAGKEATSLPAGVVLAEVRSLVLTGRHALDRDWTLTYAAGVTRQGDFYTRRGINLGVQYAF